MQDLELGAGLVGELWGLSFLAADPTGEYKSQGWGGRPSWAKLQHPSARMWAGLRGMPDWASLQQMLALLKARMGEGWLG